MNTRSDAFSLCCKAPLLAMIFLSVLTTACLAGSRIAIVSGSRSERMAHLVDLTIARLADDPQLELLERDAIGKVLNEQKLTLAGLVDSQQAIIVGKLLNVDLFAVIETSGEQDSIPGVVVFDARTGVRYCDESLPTAQADLEQVVAKIASVIRMADHKQHGEQNRVKKVGFMSVRNADLPRSSDGLCDAIALLIERGLPRSPDLAVLERRRLSRVNDERNLAPGDVPADLHAALVMIDLQFSRGKDGRGLKATALIKHAGRDQTDTVETLADELDAALVAEGLSQRIIEVLGATPLTRMADRKSEAKRFDAEARHHLGHQRFENAVQAEEAAVALDPDTADYRERLAISLIRCATYLFSPLEFTITKGSDQAWMDTRISPTTRDALLAMTERSLDINHGLTESSAHSLSYNYHLCHLADRLRGLRKSAPPDIRSQIEGLLAACVKRSLDHCEQWAKVVASDPRKQDAYTSTLSLEMGPVKSASLDSHDYAKSIAQMASRWIDTTRDLAPETTSTDGGELLNNVLRGFVTPVNWPWRTDEHEFARQMAPVIIDMQQHRRPLVQLYGLLGKLRGDLLSQAASEEDVCSQFAMVYRPLAQKIITAPEPWNAVRTRFAAYEAWRTAIEDMPLKNKQEFVRREAREIALFMIRRQEAEYKILQSSLEHLEPEDCLDLIRRVRSLMESSQFAGVTSEKNRILSLVATQEQKILGSHPEMTKSSVRTPWQKATRIFDVAQFKDLSELLGCLQDDGRLYGVCLQFEGDRGCLRLAEIPLGGKPVELLSRVDLNLSSGQPAAHLRPRFVSSCCMDRDNIYVGARGAGVIVFPTKLGKARQISIDQGLPSTDVSSIAVIEDQLFVGFEDGYLVKFDLKSGECDIIASSRRKQKLSPFDDAEKFRVPTLVADPKRRRVVFVIGNHVWQLTLADGMISPVLDLTQCAIGRSEPRLAGPTIAWSGPLREQKLLISNPFHVIELDLKEDRAIEVHAPALGVFQTHPPNLIIEGTLWSGDTFSRLRLGTQQFEILPNPGPDAATFRPKIYLGLTQNKKQMIAAGTHAVWLLDLAN